MRKAAPAPTSSATRVSSSTSRESASTEPRLPVFSAELVKHFQNKTKDFDSEDNDNTLPAEGPLAVILDNVPSETSQKPAPLCPVGKSAPQMKVGKTTSAHFQTSYRSFIQLFCLALSLLISHLHNLSTKDCKCVSGPVTKGLDGNPRGGCIKPLADHGIEELAEGWCFLENLQVNGLCG